VNSGETFFPPSKSKPPSTGVENPVGAPNSAQPIAGSTRRRRCRPDDGRGTALPQMNTHGPAPPRDGHDERDHQSGQRGGPAAWASGKEG